MLLHKLESPLVLFSNQQDVRLLVEMLDLRHTSEPLLVLVKMLCILKLADKRLKLFKEHET